MIVILMYTAALFAAVGICGILERLLFFLEIRQERAARQTRRRRAA